MGRITPSAQMPLARRLRTRHLSRGLRGRTSLKGVVRRAKKRPNEGILRVAEGRTYGKELASIHKCY